jgi:hypothetical protein
MKSEDNKHFWEKWAVRYDKTMRGSGRLYWSIISNMEQTLNRNMTVLELACGTGLLSVKIAPTVKHLESTDFSQEMIVQAKKKVHSSKLFFSVQDATALPYAPKTFDAVIISNALHIMPEPQKALSEIKRVLRDDGILIAPTFTAAGSLGGRIKNRIMELSGFKVFHKWTPESYLAFLKSNGFEIQKSEVLSGALTLTYAEARKNN